MGRKWDGSGTEVGRKWDGSGTEVGQKWDGLVESSAAFFLPSRCTMPTFHAAGMAWVVQQQLYMCSSAGNKEGHLLMTE